ncbi:MAG: ATP-dependent sacrificial sulfur transferase LarE [Verrucomicrobia bacterium]|nr:MAG: ATP-dependent sacrificial sulfur transferase LarE [Verrucomicrobiota bacterium]
MAATPIEKLEHWFRPLKGSLTAFSGGVDSTLVLSLSRRFLGSRGVGVISDSPSLKRSDLQIARRFCETHDIALRVIHTRELDDPNYSANPIDRCFHCKSTLYTDLVRLRSEYPGFTLLNGTNCDDLGDYRPGLKAAEQNAIRSPLAECGLGKSDVRRLARQFDLAVWDKPASPCLSSRIPYGQPVTVEKLQQIEEAESILGGLGFDRVRVRHIDGVARIEVPLADVAELQQVLESVSDRILELGFSSVETDDEGLVSGKLNRAIL